MPEYTKKEYLQEATEWIDLAEQSTSYIHAWRRYNTAASLAKKGRVDIYMERKRADHPPYRIARNYLELALGHLEQEESVDMEHETKKALLVVALDLLEDASSSCTPDRPWRLIGHAEDLCNAIGVPITQALGTELRPLHRAAMEVVNGAIDKLSQKGDE